MWNGSRHSVAFSQAARAQSPIHLGQVDHASWDVGVGHGDPVEQHLTSRVPFDLEAVPGAVAAGQGGEVGLHSVGVDHARAGPAGPQLLPPRSRHGGQRAFLDPRLEGIGGDRRSAPGRVDATALYRWAKAAGSVYQEELRRRLSERLGVGWGPDRNGCREMVGFSEAQLRAFSKRTVLAR
jgi:hypothetical protein